MVVGVNNPNFLACTWIIGIIDLGPTEATAPSGGESPQDFSVPMGSYNVC